MAGSAAFAALREAFDLRYRETSAAAFTQAEGTALGTGIPELDLALAGGLPKGAIATFEGPASSGRTTLAARTLAMATRGGGAAAVIAWDEDPAGTPHPPALAVAGVALERLLIVRVPQTLDVIRAADILLRSAAFGVVVMPSVPSSRAVGAAAWSRLANLTHRANAVLLAIGIEASDELRYAASVRVECALERTAWAGAGGPFRDLAGGEVHAAVRKHKRASPGREARVGCVPFEPRAPLGELSYACRDRSSATTRSLRG